MKNKFIFLFVLLILFLGFIPLESHQSATLKRDIHVGKDDVQENIVAFGGNVLIEGKVKNDVVVIGGTITLAGEVEGAVVGIGSTITLKSTAVIKHDLVTIGGNLNKEAGYVVKGDMVYFASSEIVSKFVKENIKAIFSLSLLPIILIFKLLATFIWLLLAMVIVAIFPKQISLASSQIRKSFWPIIGTGILSLIIYTIAVIFFALLSFILIGIPFFLALIAAGLAIKIFGRITLFYFFGESLSRAFNWQKTSPLLLAVLGLILVSLISLVPILGFLFSLCLTIIGWGVAIRTRFGTKENWFKRKA